MVLVATGVFVRVGMPQVVLEPRIVRLTRVFMVPLLPKVIRMYVELTTLLLFRFILITVSRRGSDGKNRL